MTLVADLKNRVDGETVVGLTGKIVRAFEPRRGTSKSGRDWVNVGMIVQDDAGDEINVTWWDPASTDWRELKDRKVEISARDGSRGLSGAKISEYTDKHGNPRISVSVNGRCVEFIDGQAPPSGGNQEAPAQNRPSSPRTPLSSVSSNISLLDTDLLFAVRRYAGVLAETGLPAETHAAVINTLIIAITNGKVKIDDLGRRDEPTEPKPADPPRSVGVEDDEDDIPF